MLFFHAYVFTGESDADLGLFQGDIHHRLLAVFGQSVISSSHTSHIQVSDSSIHNAHEQNCPLIYWSSSTKAENVVDAEEKWNTVYKP